MEIKDKAVLAALKAAADFAYGFIGRGGAEQVFWEGYAQAKGVKPEDLNRGKEAGDLIDARIALEQALADPKLDAKPRGLADVNKFLDKVREHTNGTKSDKYAADRAIEPVDAIVDWYGQEWLAGTAVKYMSRIHLGTEKDLFKTVHYLGMLWNARQKEAGSS